MLTYRCLSLALAPGKTVFCAGVHRRGRRVGDGAGGPPAQVGREVRHGRLRQGAFLCGVFGAVPILVLGVLLSLLLSILLFIVLLILLLMFSH